MKTIVSAIFLLFASLAVAQPVQCQPDRTCVYISSNATAAAVQLDNRDGNGIGLLVYTNAYGILTAALTAESTGIMATSANGGTALNVYGKMVKNRVPGNRIKLYDTNTGALVGEFEFQIE
jgi:hypothetical protein